MANSVKKSLNVGGRAIYALSQQLQAESACQEWAKLRITLRITRGDSDLPVSSPKVVTAAVSYVIHSLHRATSYQKKKVGKKKKVIKT